MEVRKKHLDVLPSDRPVHGVERALSRLVEPLDEILVLMKRHASAQRILLTAIAVAIFASVLTVSYALKLTAKIDEVERRLNDVARTSADARDKTASTEREAGKIRSLVETLASAAPAPKTSASMSIER